MRRWLIVVGLLVAGLLMVGRADDALAARHSPSLLQKILSALTPRPTPQHYVGTSKPVATRKTEPPVAKPVLMAQPVQAPPPPEAVTPDPIAQVIEKTQPVRDVQPEPASKPVRTTQTTTLVKPARATLPANTAQPVQAAQPELEPVHTTQEKKADRLRPVQPIQTPQEVKAAGPVPAKPATEKGWTLASVQLGPAPIQAVMPPMPIRTGTMLTTVEPAQAKPAIEKAQPAPADLYAKQTIKKGKSGKAHSVEIAQPAQTTQPMQVAILGVPNLKAALPAEPADEPRVPAARPEPKSACNGGQRVVSAYYWEGRHTASGQPFNPHGMTAAHRTLPFGTRLNVTNPRTGKTVNVLINDRGPYVRGVSLDLSLGAAQAIGLQGTGSVCIL
jgi:rare lipoprotein A